jgi:hypothetical protein
MWQTSSQRSKAISNQKKREKERARRPFRFKRVSAQIRVVSPNHLSAAAGAETGSSEITEGRIVLNDLSSGGMGLFSVFPIAPGSTVSITLEEPVKAVLKAKIVWCQEYAADSHILSAHSYSYRLGVKFVFDDPKEAQGLRKFCEELWNSLYTDKEAS